MKKYFKTTFFSIVAVYFILSFIFNFKTYFVSKNQLAPYKEMLLFKDNINNTHIQQSSEYNLNTSDLIAVTNLSGKLEIASQNVFIILVSIIIGMIIGVVKTLKEFSKLKYLLYFIIGYVIYISIFIIFIYFSEQIYHLDLLSSTLNIAFKFSLLYILFFLIAVIANIIISKFQVNKLNKLLHKPKKDN